jgi:hypothetical protein
VNTLQTSSFLVLSETTSLYQRTRTNYLKATLAIRATIGPTREPP